MTSSVKARHRKAAPPLTPLSTAGPVARRGLAVAASSGLALTIIASGANAAGDGTDVGDSAGALTNAGVDTLANEAREAVTTNAAITTSETSRLEASDPVAEVTAEAPVFEQPAAQEPAPQVEEVSAPAAEQAPAPAEEAAPQQAPAAPSASGSIAATAMQYVGSPYVWGAEGPSAFDCSGLVSYVYGQFGTSLPHSSEGIRSVGTVISAAEAQPGDVIWWSGHVAIYAGDGMMVSAESESVGVQYLPVRSGGTFLRM
ncbi:C40 family peptidase [Actinomyces massiliensis]|uniref:C40 family peptidase n=1 Tax=Actinomyces massiliensis TaxID=461393 RepID=UPI0028EB730B|nr:C40 family peptidase [Actinomyces massiliensis]